MRLFHKVCCSGADEARTVARTFIDRFVSIFGIPLQLHSDQGTNFESVLFKETCALLGIDKRRTSGFRPQSDCLVERSNRTLQNMLAKFVSNNPYKWDEYLSLVTLAYNTSVHEITKFSPCKIMFCRE